MKRRRGGQLKPALRRKIDRLYSDRGLCQAAIARELRMAPSSIAYHIRALGYEPIKHFRRPKRR